MPRSIWNGTITFGLVNVPVKLHSAVEPKTVRFREVHVTDGARIEHRRFCSVEGREVPYEEIVRGFEVGPEEYVVLEREEIAAAVGARTHLAEVEAFVDAGAIDPVFYERAYYLGAGRGGEDAYRLLHDALERTGRAAICRFTFRDRVYLAAIRPLGRVLALHTMRFADEIVPGGEIELATPQRGPSRREIEMAELLVASLHEDFDPRRYRDEYREAVLVLIERKAAGETIAPAEPQPPDEPSDLAAALEASLAGRSG